MSDLARKVQALLFAEGDSLTLKKLMQQLECDANALSQALGELSASLNGSGLTLVRTDATAALATGEDLRDVVARARSHEEREIGDAGLEVIAILLYEGPSTRATIDYVRGVNSSSTMRTLLLRGLIERTGNPEDGREYIYRPTTELLAYLGAPEAKSLPDYATISEKLKSFKSQPEAFHGGDTANTGVV